MTGPSSANDWTELLKLPALPSSEDRLFASQEDWRNNACINWCHDGWGLYASGYKDAADLLVQHVEQRSSGQDSLVYPVLFLYRQYLELQIKDLIRQGRCLKDISSDFPVVEYSFDRVGWQLIRRAKLYHSPHQHFREVFNTISRKRKSPTLAYVDQITTIARNILP